MKHDHKKTKKLKVALFSMIMFLPFIAIGVTCATHIFNKEVTEETETATINYMYETNEPQTNQKLSNNHIYIYNNINHINTNDDNGIYCGNVYIYESNNLQFSYVTNDVNYGIWLIDDTNDLIIQYYINATEINIYTIDLSNENMQILFVYNADFREQEGSTDSNINNWYTITPQNLIPIESVDITTNPQDQTTNIFYDSCEQVEQSFILNWCEQANPVRNPIQSFTNAFSLPSNHIINTLITYWICIAMIYIVIDIIVECIVMLTHFFNKEF